MSDRIPDPEPEIHDERPRQHFAVKRRRPPAHDVSSTGSESGEKLLPVSSSETAGAAQPQKPGPPTRPRDEQSEEAIEFDQRGLRRSILVPDLEMRERLAGAHVGDRYVRLQRPARRHFRRSGPGLIIATEETNRPRDRIGRVLQAFKRIIIGSPLTTAAQTHERLSKVKALAVLSSDALSSSAYATEEILRVLILAGVGALTLSIPIAVAIALLLVIVGVSYRQTIQAYPQGGGSYIVAKDNLGALAGLIAAAALMIDYILTVAVSVASGVAQLISAFPTLRDLRIEIAVGIVLLIVLVNLRGVREAGSVFAVPTYLFLFAILSMVVVGVARVAFGLGPAEDITPEHMPEVAESLTVFLILRAFASGCAALTGVEAISDGVPAFKPPEWRNARTTLAWMVGILGFLFMGITLLAHQFEIIPSAEGETVISLIARATYGTNLAYFGVIGATMLILFLAANTAFSDFPRLGYFLARDGFLPHMFRFRGDRLAFTTGIVVLGAFAALVLILFDAETHLLIPLYAVGVFVSFTLSQAGMVVRWNRLRGLGWRRSMLINALGAVTTGIVATVIASTKLLSGAWMIVMLIPLVVMLFYAIYRHYEGSSKQLALAEEEYQLTVPAEQVVIVPVSGLNHAVVQTLNYARSISPLVIAVHVTDDPDEGKRLKDQFAKLNSEIPLVVLESPYRSLISPLLAYIDAIDEQDENVPVTVILSQIVPKNWWEHLLHNQSALRLRAALFFRPNTVVVDYPYHMH